MILQLLLNYSAPVVFWPERKMMSNAIVESEIDVSELWTILKYSIR
jgi:hypothetical protein